jgi:serine/threonine-protein kinase RsbW
MRPRAIELRIDSRLEDVSLLGIATRRIAEEAGFGEGDAYNVELCVTEAVTNAIRHAYGGEPGHDVTVRLVLHADRLEMAVLDDGSPVPEDRRAPRAPAFDPADLSSIPEGGRGVYLMATLMDGLEFGTEGGRNRVQMTRLKAVTGKGEGA